jgi:hypothetical protein
MTLSKVVRKGSYQGVSQWGINTSSEVTPSRKTAQKWAELENARNPKNQLANGQTIVDAHYRGGGCGGGVQAQTEDEAIAAMQAQIDRGYFQADVNKTPMHRVEVSQ